ncbi:MAG TPA: CPBP family intramembrane glutamic endopeptidase [Dehalococcoidia bacterium]
MFRRRALDFATNRLAGEAWDHPADGSRRWEAPAQQPTGTRFSPAVVLTAAIGLAAIALGEAVTEAVDPRAGISVHAVLLTALIVQACRVTEERLFRLLVALCLAPLIRILSLSMPLGEVSVVYWYLIIAGPLLAGALAVARTLRLSRSDLGLRLSNLPLQVGVSMAGFLFGIAEYLILRPTPLIESFSLREALLPAVVLLVGTGFVEEFIFRGIMQSATRDTLGRWNLIYVSAIFAVLHLGYHSALDVAFVFAVGWLFAVVVRRTGSLVGVTVSHGITNITLFLVAPFLVGPGLV